MNTFLIANVTMWHISQFYLDRAFLRQLSQTAFKKY